MLKRMISVRSVAALLVLSLGLAAPRLGLAQVSYTATVYPPAGTVRMQMELASPNDRLAVKLPAWVPGFYLFREHYKSISNVQAFNPEGKILRVLHPSSREWVVENPAKERVRITYTVRGDDLGLGFFGTHVDSSTAFINGGSCFLYPSNRKEEPVDLKVNVPTGWAIATAMDGDETKGEFTAGGYDELIDHPIQMGIFKREKFTVEGIPFEAIYVHPLNRPMADIKWTTERLKKFSVPAIKMMETAPFKRFLYIIHLQVGDFDGGLEHRSSTVLAVPDSESLELNTLATHEFFHSWNVKQIRPFVLGPFNYQERTKTDNLWFAEGVTDYYAHLHAYRSGVLNGEWLRQALEDQITYLQRGRRRKTMTLAECSREAWQNGGLGIGDLSYYNKGLVVGMILDAMIRTGTEGSRSLDDVMRLMYRKYRLPNPGYEEDGILKAIIETIGGDEAAWAPKIRQAYEKMVYSTDELPYEYLKGIGLVYYQPGQPVPELGYEVKGVTVTQVSAQLYDQGLRRGDVFRSINGVAVRVASSFEGLPESYPATVLRNGEEIALNLKMASHPAGAFSLQANPFATREERKRLDQWLARPKIN